MEKTCSVFISVRLGTSALLHLRSNTHSTVWLVEVPEGVRQHLTRSLPVGKKSLSCLALESLWWSKHCKSHQARHAFNLPIDWCDCLDWNQISIEKTYHNHTRHSSLKHVKTLFLESLLVCSFPDAFASLSYFTMLARKSGIRHIWSYQTLYSIELWV